MPDMDALRSRKLCICMCDLDSPPDFETIKDRVRNARFICRNCGRAAANEQDLCNPEKL